MWEAECSQNSVAGGGCNILEWSQAGDMSLKVQIVLTCTWELHRQRPMEWQ